MPTSPEEKTVRITKIIVLFLLFAVETVPMPMLFAGGPGTGRKNALAAGTVSKNALRKQSENKGRTGEYMVKTDNPKINYFVCVPSTYSDTNPAGIHVHFHGGGDDWEKSAPKFGSWRKTMLERFNLIGINMQFLPGVDSLKTHGTPTVEPTRAAIEQVMADYKIVNGRGTISSFSGGGWAHQSFVKKYGQSKSKENFWPFNHSSAYSSNYYLNSALSDPRGVKAMTWLVTCGRSEWLVGGTVRLGFQTSTLYDSLLREAERGGSRDVLFKTIPGKPHWVDAREVVVSAELFNRSDIMLAPFVYEPDFGERELLSIAKTANARRLGEALSAVEKIPGAKSPKNGDGRDGSDRSVRAAQLREMIERRVEAVLKMLDELAEKDPVVYVYYASLAAGQLAKTPHEKSLRAALAEMQKKVEYRNAQQAGKLLAENFMDLFQEKGALNPAKKPVLEQILQLAGERSLVGGMAAEFLTEKKK